jgi:hypothetical protein
LIETTGYVMELFDLLTKFLFDIRKSSAKGIEIKGIPREPSQAILLEGGLNSIPGIVRIILGDHGT